MQIKKEDGSLTDPYELSNACQEDVAEPLNKLIELRALCASKNLPFFGLIQTKAGNVSHLYFPDVKDEIVESMLVRYGNFLLSILGSIDYRFGTKIYPIMLKLFKQEE